MNYLKQISSKILQLSIKFIKIVVLVCCFSWPLIFTSKFMENPMQNYEIFYNWANFNKIKLFHDHYCYSFVLSALLYILFTSIIFNWSLTVLDTSKSVDFDANICRWEFYIQCLGWWPSWILVYFLFSLLKH